MKNPIKTFLLLMAMLFLSGACAHLSSDPAGTEALTTSVKKVWDAKLNGDWEVVYDNAVKEYRNKVEKTSYLKNPKVVVKEYAIKEITILEPGKRAVSVMQFKINPEGYEFQINRFKEEWLWEEGAWHLNLLPTLGSPMGKKIDGQ